MTVSRRTLLLGAAVATAGSLLGAPAVANAVPWDGAPVQPLASSTHLSLTWAGRGPESVRVRLDGVWRSVPVRAVCSAGRDGGPVTGSALAPIAGVEQYAISSVGVVGVVEEIAAGATPASAPAPLRQGAGYTLVSRAGWGADESLRFDSSGNERFPTQYFRPQVLTVHHTVDEPGSDPAATVRAIYRSHTISRNFGDIGYQLLIDPAGLVYEGRWSGLDGRPVFGGDQSNGPRSVMGAHVGGHNSGNIGVSMLGDFTNREPTAAAQEALVQVLASLARECGLDPEGTTRFRNPSSGEERTVRTISGHRDWNATQCPGNTFYPELPEIRGRVAAIL